MNRIHVIGKLPYFNQDNKKYIFFDIYSSSSKCTMWDVLLKNNVHPKILKKYSQNFILPFIFNKPIHIACNVTVIVSRSQQINHRAHADVIKWKHIALLALYVGNSPVTSEFPSQRPVTRIFDVFFDLGLNKRLSKQSWCWWFVTPSRPSWRHCNVQKSSNVDVPLSRFTHCGRVTRIGVRDIDHHWFR